MVDMVDIDWDVGKGRGLMNAVAAWGLANGCGVERVGGAGRGKAGGGTRIRGGGDGNPAGNDLLATGTNTGGGAGSVAVSTTEGIDWVTCRDPDGIDAFAPPDFFSPFPHDPNSLLNPPFPPLLFPLPFPGAPDASPT